MLIHIRNRETHVGVGDFGKADNNVVSFQNRNQSVVESGGANSPIHPLHASHLSCIINYFKYFDLYI